MQNKEHFWSKTNVHTLCWRPPFDRVLLDQELSGSSHASHFFATVFSQPCLRSATTYKVDADTILMIMLSPWHFLSRHPPLLSLLPALPPPELTDELTCQVDKGMLAPPELTRSELPVNSLPCCLSPFNSPRLLLCSDGCLSRSEMQHTIKKEPLAD